MSAEVIAGIITTIITGCVGYGIAKVNSRTTRSTSMTPSYEALDKRNASLEDRIASIEGRYDILKQKLDDVSEDRDNFAEALDDVKALLRQFVDWINSGANPPPPTIPPHLRDQIGDYEVARVTEISRTTTERIVYPEEQP
jgi:uncharacterized coiled-coil protein SlyX